MGQEASFAVQLNGARGLIDAKIHTPSGAIEECFVSELDSGKVLSDHFLSAFSTPVKQKQPDQAWVPGGLHAAATFQQPEEQKPHSDRLHAVSLQSSTPSGSSPGRTAFIPSTSASTAATFPAVPSRSGWETSGRLEILDWCLPLGQD